jgi:hypothetical protein
MDGRHHWQTEPREEIAKENSIDRLMKTDDAERSITSGEYSGIFPRGCVYMDLLSLAAVVRGVGRRSLTGMSTPFHSRSSARQ